MTLSPILRCWKAIGIMSAVVFSIGSESAVAAGNVTGGAVSYGGHQGFLAAPSGGGKYPSLILIHEWWGLNDNIRENARRFAALGYVALAVDLYGGAVANTRDEARSLAGAVRKNKAAAIANLKAAAAYLNQHDDTAGPERMASVGWCFGGGWSYQMARNNLGVKASVIYYGFFNPKDDLSKMRATIMGHFGESDRAIKVDNVRVFQSKLKTLNGAHEVFIYPNAGHAFANEGGKNYNKEAADTAWRRTAEFLKGALK